MNLKDFLEFIEIKTKPASIVPFIIGMEYSIYRYGSFKLENTIFMFISLLSFDMTTTAINNYCDYKKSKVENINKGGIVSSGNLSEQKAVLIIFSLLFIAVFSGIILVCRTNLIVLFIGCISFFIGIFYTFGPIPISRMPLGELFSGFFMGFVIMFLAIYINVFDSSIISFSYSNRILSLSINIMEILYIFLVSITCFSGIFNIMLANNICDLSQDIINNRYTLVYYIGKRNSLIVFRIMYYLAYIVLIVLIAAGILPKIFLLSLITFIPINKNINEFVKNPVKDKTFILSVKNFIIVNMTQIVLMYISISLFNL